MSVDPYLELVIPEPLDEWPEVAALGTARKRVAVLPSNTWATGNSADDDLEAELDHNRAVADELRRLKVRKAAQDALRAESEPEAQPFDAGTLREILSRPEAPEARVEGLIPWDASTLIVAQRKTGKTTLELNLSRSLLTGDRFLGTFAVRPVTGTVAVLNFEVSAGLLARWADDIGIDRDRLYLVNLRGRRNPLRHADDRARLADDLRSRDVESLIVDPFGRAYTGTSQNDSGEVGAWLVDLDVFARGEVGAKDLILTAHAGWNGERTRGSSALEDWADSIVTLTRDSEDESLRFLRATGRDVEIDEDRLDFDPMTRTLSMSGSGSRRTSREDRAVETATGEVLRYVIANPDASGNDIETGVSGNNGVILKARRRLVSSGALFEHSRTGKGGGKCYRATGPNSEHPPTSPSIPRGDVLTSPTSPIEGEVRRGKMPTQPPPALERCSTCGEPMTDLDDGATTHPLCEVTP